MSIDPEILRQLMEKAAINRAKRAAFFGKEVRKAPIVYVPSGTTLLRFYMDSENNVPRTLSRHKVGKNSVHCLEGCPVCTYLFEMEQQYPDFQEAWKLRRREITIVYAWIFSSSENNNFIKTETPVLLMGNYKLGRELNDHIADIEEEEFAKMLDPTTDHFLWELKSGDNSRDFSVAPTLKRGRMAPLPETLYPLSQCIHPEGEEPTTGEVHKFIKIVNEVYETDIKTTTQDEGIDCRREQGIYFDDEED